MPSSQPKTLSELDHANFDRALLASHLVHCAWHTAPVVRQPVYTERDFNAFFQRRLQDCLCQPEFQAEMQKTFPEFPTLAVARDDLSGRRKFFRHLYTQLASLSTKVHSRIAPPERILSELRLDLWNVEAGYIVAESPAHPLWNMGHPGTSPQSEQSVRLLDPTRQDRVLAAQLRGGGRPHKHGPDGPISLLIKRALPELLVRHEDCRVIEYAVHLRQRLLTIVGDATDWDEAMKKECLTEIVNEWALITLDRDEQALRAVEMQVGVDRNDPLPVVRKALMEPFLATPDGDRIWAKVLEERTLLAVDQGDEAGYEEVLEAWNRALQVSPIPPCVRPSLGLAHLAISANTSNFRDFRDRIALHPDGDETAAN